MQLSMTDDFVVLDLGDSENTFDRASLTSVLRGLDRLEASESRSPLLTVASGKFWSNGFDLAWVSDVAARTETRRAAHQLLSRVLTLGRPTMAVIQGHAFGLGALLALAHDFRIMREDRGYFCLPEVDLGIPFTDGMSALARAKLPTASISAAMVCGERFNGANALKTGIVESIAPERALRALAEKSMLPRGGKDPVTVSAIKSELYGDVLAALAAP